MDRMHKGRRGCASVLLLVAGLTCWFQSISSSPSSFANGTSGGVTEAQKTALKEARKNWIGSPRYLKFLLSSADMVKLGSSRMKQVAEKTGTMIKWSPKGDHYPWLNVDDLMALPTKVVVIAGEEQAVLDAFRSIHETVAKNSKHPIPFIIPDSAESSLYGSNGEKMDQKREALNAKIIIKRTPTSESQVIAFSKDSETPNEIAKWLLEEQKDYIEDMRKFLSTRYQSDASEQMTEIYVLLNEKQVKQFIGKGGKMLRNFHDVFRIEVDVHKEGGPNGSNIVKMKGLLGDVHAAHRELTDRFVAKK